MKLKEKLEVVINEYVKEINYSGVIKIKQDEITLFEGAFGYASKPFRVPNTMEMRFATASITKMFTALGILQLVQDGKLNLDDKIVDYLCIDNVTLSKDITIEHLLTHCSGISDYFNENDPNGFENLWMEIPGHYIDNLMKMLPLFIDEEAENTPGSEFSYNGAGYILLGLVIEKLTGMDYFTYINENVFKKAFMMETDFIPVQNVAENVAEGYIPIKNEDNHILGWKKNIFSIPSYGLSDGGSFSSAKDLTKYMKKLRNGELLNEEYTKKLLTPVVTVAENHKYGYGMWFKVDGENIIKYGHTGEDPGVSARVFYYPESNIDLVLLSNHSFSTGDLMKRIDDIIENL